MTVVCSHGAGTIIARFCRDQEEMVTLLLRSFPKLAVPLLIVSGCLGEASLVNGCEHNGPAKVEKTVTITEKHHGTTVDLKQGATLIVRLEAAPGTGYGWQIIQNDATKLKLIGEPVFESAGQKAGGTEHEVFHFRALATGTTTLKLHYLRPWEKDTPPLKTYQVKARILK